MPRTHAVVTHVKLCCGMQMVHVVMLWAVMPLHQVGWQACVVDLEEIVLLGMAATLLVWGHAAPTWLKDGIVWMFPVIIFTMMIGDALAAGAKLLGGIWLAMCRLCKICGCAAGRSGQVKNK